MRWILGVGGLLLGACQTTTDPAQGGFINGVSAISSGSYEQRASNLDDQVAAERVRQKSLREELQRLDSEFASLKRQIRQQKARISASGQTLPSTLTAQADSSLSTEPSATGNTEADLETLRRSVAAARQIVAELAEIQS